MKRTIVTQATLPAAALDELKDWLAISTSAQDAVLTALLRSSLETCEAFTGQMPLQAVCEEILGASGDWQNLPTRPVQAITLVEGIPAEGARFTFARDAYEIDIDAEATGRIRILRQGAAGRIAVQLTAGIAADWASLPESIRQGVIRLAAFTYRDRDAAANTAGPPAAVTALWRPWRRMHLL